MRMPCKLCGWTRGGAEIGERYCSQCDESLVVTRPLSDQTERRRRKVHRNDEGAFSPWALGFYLRRR